MPKKHRPSWGFLWVFEKNIIGIILEQNMDHFSLWEHALAALQNEIPQASFDTWMRDTKPISLKVGVMIIAARNVYARDWLESRMTDVGERILSELAGTAIKIRFVAEDAEADPETEAQQEETRSEAGFDAEVVDATRYQDEVHPERVVVLPGYALRLLENGDLTPKQMSLWMGFRQAVYAQRRQGEETVRNIPHWEVMRFAMMSRASYFRELRGQTDIAGGLVEKIESGSMGDANCYRVHVAPRLTSRDCTVIQSILTAEVAQAGTYDEGCQSALAALKSLTDRNPAEYLDTEVTTASSQPRTVIEIVRGVIGWKGDMPHELADEAERLTDRILRAFGQVVITHYFLTHVVPALGFSHAQAWTIIMLRDRCWFDYETHTQHDFAIVSGGLGTLAKWVGASRRSMERWLAQPEFAAFVQSVQFESQDEIRPQQGEIFRVRHAELLAPEVEHVRLGNGQSETLGDDKMRLGLRQSETQSYDKMRLGLRQNETLFKTSIKPLLNPYQPQKSPPMPPQGKPQDGRGESAAGRGSDAYWNFAALCVNNAVQPGSKAALLKKFSPNGIKKLSQGFVSWLLYAFVSERVKDPTGLVIRRLLSEVHAGAGGDFDRLAAFPPWRLKLLMAGGKDDSSLEAEIYRLLRFDHLLPEHKRDLYRRLFGESFNPNTQKIPPQQGAST
jgi:hypothetical protein